MTMIVFFVALVVVGIAVMFLISRQDNVMRDLEKQRREYRRQKAYNAKRIELARKKFEHYDQRRRAGEAERE